MGQSMGMLDFFVLEAGEYLERLDALAQAPAGPFPNADEFLRIARAWRGGALMASQQPMARAAQGLEAAGRALKDGRVAWDERVRGAVIRAVDDCKKYLHRIRTPAADDAARAEEIGAALERITGRTSGTARAAGAGLDAGGRAFVAREAAAIASALDHAAQGLAADPLGRAALAGVAPAMSALRGVAVLGDLPPLGDLLAGVEGAIRETLATAGAVGPAVPAVFDAAAKALARAAREVVDAGRPTTDSDEARVFTSRLLRAFAATGEVRPIEALFYDDAGPHVVRQGTAPAPLSGVEIVSQGEFLERAAEELARAASPVVRDLRLFGIAVALRPLASGGGSSLAAGVGRLADAARTAIDRGTAADRIEAFAAAIAQAARALRTAASADAPAVVAELGSVAAALGALGAGAPAAPAGGDGDLAAAYATMERMIVERGLPLGSLEELLRGPSAAAPALEEEGVVPIESLAPVAEEEGVVPIEALAPVAEEEGVVPIEALAPDMEAVVPIEQLLYRGQAALRRALELKAELALFTAAPAGASSRLHELQREVFDLIELGLGAQP